MSDGTAEGRREACFLVGVFMTLWIITYCLVRGFAPRIIGRKSQSEAETFHKVLSWFGLLKPVPFALALTT